MGAVRAAVLVSLLPVSAHSQGDRRFATVLRIGSADGAEWETFGQIVDVAVDARGNIFVLDGQALEIRWFDSTGTYRGRGARKGRGPGELTQPVSLLVGASGRVLVLDLRNRRLSEYMIADRRLAHRRDINLGFRATDFCILDDRIFTVGAQTEPQLVQEIDSVGNVVRSFGRREAPPVDVMSRLGAAAGSILQAEFNNAILHCDQSSRTIFLAHIAVPIVQAYSARGQRLWRSELTGFHAPALAVAHEGALSVTFNARTKLLNSAAAITTDGRGNILVSLDTRRQGSVGSWTDVRMLRVADGTEIDRFTSADVIAATNGPHVFGYHQLPVPQTVKYRIPAR